MKVCALTGGIATGKSTVVEILQHLDPNIIFFDADQSVQRFLEKENVITEIVSIFGVKVQHGDGSLNRSELREIVFGFPERRKLLEGVLHPKVRKECLEKRDLYAKDPSATLFVADIPLLFESGFDFDQELNLVVAVSETTQRSRLKDRNHFGDRMISSILEAQLPIMEKVALGDVVFWNEGCPSILEKQLMRFLQFITIT